MLFQLLIFEARFRLNLTEKSSLTSVVIVLQIEVNQETKLVGLV